MLHGTGMYISYRNCDCTWLTVRHQFGIIFALDRAAEIQASGCLQDGVGLGYGTLPLGLQHRTSPGLSARTSRFDRLFIPLLQQKRLLAGSPTTVDSVWPREVCCWGEEWDRFDDGNGRTSSLAEPHSGSRWPGQPVQLTSGNQAGSDGGT
jgi:hypothetical protein